MGRAAWIALIGFVVSPGYGALLAPALGLGKWSAVLGAPGLWLVLFAGFLAWSLARDIRRRSPRVEDAPLRLWWTLVICVAVLGLVALGAAILLQLAGV